MATWLTRPPWLCTFECSPVLMPQSDRVRVEVWCSSGESSCGVQRVDVPIQSGVFSFFVSFFSCLWSPRTVVLYSSAILIETRTVLCGSLKKNTNVYSSANSKVFYKYILAKIEEPMLPITISLSKCHPRKNIDAADNAQRNKAEKGTHRNLRISPPFSEPRPSTVHRKNIPISPNHP